MYLKNQQYQYLQDERAPVWPRDVAVRTQLGDRNGDVLRAHTELIQILDIFRANAEFIQVLDVLRAEFIQLLDIFRADTELIHILGDTILVTENISARSFRFLAAGAFRFDPIAALIALAAATSPSAAFTAPDEILVTNEILVRF